MAPDAEDKLVLVTGGFGFIGSHVAAALHHRGFRVRIVDISDQPSIDGTFWHEFEHGDLRDPPFCHQAVHGAHTVLHFAANMGGMGVIHEANDFTVYNDNHLMTLHLLQASLKAGVKCFFYASSACVYPNVLQTGAVDISLQEDDAWKDHPPAPQGLYGLEKLHSEILVHQFSSRMDVRIARFHNVFGPGGVWFGGREKAPAALMRKALVGNLLKDANPPPTFEIWGDGQQRRSFLYIEDAVEGVMRLLESDCRGAVNIGSDRSVTIKELADIALRCAGLDPKVVEFSYDLEKPVGVISRNSDNKFVSSKLGWTPSTSLETGMQQTGEWIGRQMNIFLNQSAIVNRQETLQTLLRSEVIQLASEPITFGILLPVTSRGSSYPSDCLHNLSQFASSLLRTTHGDTQQTLCGQVYKIVVFLGIDHDDQFLLASEGAKYCRAEDGLHVGGIQDVRTIICKEPRGHVCAIWRRLAEEAWNEGCDYMVLMGDDVVLRDDDWMSAAHKEFTDIAASRNLPHGFGCVAFTDISFPGMPTFPIIHRTHLDIFQGKVVPDIFINQDGDPFLFQLYRRFGCSTMFSSTLSNGIGGEGAARYKKLHAKEWTFEPLDDATREAQEWLADNHSESTIPGNTGEKSLSKPDASRKITIDVVIPCYRVLVPILEAILNLKSSPSCEVMFIVIIDNPSSPDIATLKRMFEHRPDIRIRVNEVNMGASESRNRGVKESAADWVHFLDDDIQPHPDLLFEAEKAIRKHPDAAGFVGNALFPVAHTVFTTAVHLAGVTYFWDIANKIDTDLPWGVTANLITRRLKDGIEYDRIFPKTGGGEDIDYCRKKREYSLQHGREAFFAAPEVVVTHPWWNEGTRSYWRFHMWSVGDGALIGLYPEHSYRDHTPNSAELILFCMLGAAGAIVTRHLSLLIFFAKALVATVLANVSHDCYRHLWRNPDRVQNMKSTIMGIWWVVAVIESSFIRMFSEMGRLRGLLGRREWMQIGKRFDWFAGRWGDGPMNEERLNGKQRFGLAASLFCGFLLISNL